MVGAVLGLLYGIAEDVFAASPPRKCVTDCTSYKLEQRLRLGGCKQYCADLTVTVKSSQANVGGQCAELQLEEYRRGQWRLLTDQGVGLCVDYFKPRRRVTIKVPLRLTIKQYQRLRESPHSIRLRGRHEGKPRITQRLIGS